VDKFRQTCSYFNSITIATNPFDNIADNSFYDPFLELSEVNIFVITFYIG